LLQLTAMSFRLNPAPRPESSGSMRFDD
jgi:hypothetical protein